MAHGTPGMRGSHGARTDRLAVTVQAAPPTRSSIKARIHPAQCRSSQPLERCGPWLRRQQTGWRQRLECDDLAIVKASFGERTALRPRRGGVLDIDVGARGVKVWKNTVP
jgi:hypothetical protein